MNPELRTYLTSLHADGVAFDASQQSRLNRRRNLDPETAELVAMLIRLTKARHVVEVGTSNGYGTIWLADAVRDTGGVVTTLDINSQDEAIANATEAGVRESIQFVRVDAGEYLAGLPAESVDMLLLDGERPEYARWWPHPYRVLRPGGLLLVDNAHHPSPEELVDFITLMNGQDGLQHLTLSVGSGLILAHKA